MSEDFIPDISHIVCIDRMGLIGESKSLIWNAPEELEHFKNTTKDSIVIMGRATFTSLNSKPLKNRINIVVSSRMTSSDSDELFIRNDLESALELAQYLALKDQKNIFIIGGESIYDQTFEYINKIYISVIDCNYYNKPILKGKSDLYYYDYYKLDNYKVTLEDSFIIKSTNFFYPIKSYVLGITSDDKLE